MSKQDFSKLTPLEALDRLVLPRVEIEVDDEGLPVNVLRGDDGKLYSILKKHLEDFEWLKSKISIDFFYNLDPEDRIRLGKMMR